MFDPVYDAEKHGKKVKTFSCQEAVLLALGAAGSYDWYEEIYKNEGRKDHSGRGIHTHERIKVLVDGSIIETTPGRVLFNQCVPKELGFQNYGLRKKKLSALVVECYKKVGLEATVRFLDAMKNIGFKEATKSSLSMGVSDVTIPEEKKALIAEAHRKVETVRKQYNDGIITSGERHSKIISIWTEVTENLSKKLYQLISVITETSMNPLFLMIDSGARGSESQAKQLGALRGLMAKPSGEIIEDPITANFREGLSVLEYFISTHGARKGLADTALKTADSGYLTRRLVDVASNVAVIEDDCETINGIEVMGIKQGQEELLSIKDRIFGRFACEDVYQPGDKTKILAEFGHMITDEQAKEIDDSGIDSLRIRSPLTCDST